MQYMNNKKGVKLLAAVMAFAMVFVAGFVVLGGEDSAVDAATGDNIKYFGGTLDGFNEVPAGTIAYIDKDTNIVSVDSDGSTGLTDADKIGSIVVRSGGYLKINSDITLTIENKTIGTFEYNANEYTVELEASSAFGGLIIEKGAYVVIDGKVVVKNGGTIYNDGLYKSLDNTTPIQDVYNGVYVNNSITVEKGGEITGNAITPATTYTSVANQMIIGSTGSVTFKSTSTTPSKVSNQSFSIIAGGTVDIDANVLGTTLVGSFTDTTDFKITSYVVLGTEENIACLEDYYWLTGAAAQVTNAASSTTYSDTGVIDLQFSVSEKKAEKMVVSGQATSKYVYAVLDVSGSVGNNAFLGTLDNHLSNVTVADSKDQSTDIYAFGITEVSKTLDVGKGAYFATIGSSNVLVSGDLVIDGSKDNRAVLVMAGIHTVTGTVKIGSVNGSTTAAGGAWKTGAGSNTDATVNMYIYNILQQGCYMVVNDDGEVSIEDYDPETFGVGSYKQMPQGTHGVSYIDSDDVFHITNLEKALAADNEDVITINSIAKDVALIAAHDFIVDADTILPEDITVNIHGKLVVKEGVSLTISEGTEITAVEGCTGTIKVSGQVYDYSVSTRFVRASIQAEVKAIDADETYFLYTTLKNALSTASEGDSIELNGDVTISKDMTIPAGITVKTGAHYIAVNPEVKLTVEGTINVNSSGKIIMIYDDAATSKIGAIDIRNIVVAASVYKVADNIINIGSTSTECKVAGIYAQGKIGDYNTAGTNFILAPAVAAENSKTLTAMTVEDKTNYAAALKFSAADNTEPTLTINENASFGDVILDGWKVTITDSKQLTANIKAEVTSGESIVKLDKVSSAITIAVKTDNSGDEAVTYLAITTTAALKGNLNIVAGEVTMDGTITVGGWDTTNRVKSVLTVDSDATLVVPKDKSITVTTKDFSSAKTTDYAGLVVKGTLTVDEGSIAATYTSTTNHKSGWILVEGTLDVSKNQNISIEGVITILGTLNINNTTDDKAKISIPANAKMIVGKAPQSVGASATVSGPLSVAGTLTVYPGADMSGAIINVTSGVPSGYKLDLVIEDDVYMTIYTSTNSSISDLIPKKISISGYKDIVNDSNGSDWYVNEGLTTAVGSNTVSNYSVVYAKTTPSTAYVQVSVGTGMSLWIDGVKYNTGDVKIFKVGEYNVEVTINPGYKGTSKILFNGSEITNGKMVVTPAMSETATTATNAIVLSAIGDISIDTGSTEPVEKDDSGMGITDYLLIVLVVLAAILVVIVAIRMMRS